MKKLIFLLALSIICFGAIRTKGNDSTPLNIYELRGNWSGWGRGEEVRYRHPLELLILVVKHQAEFFFHVDEKGNIIRRRYYHIHIGEQC